MIAQGTWARYANAEATEEDEDDDDEAHWHGFFQSCAEVYGWTFAQTADLTLAQLPYVLSRRDPCVLEDPSPDEMAFAAGLADEE